MALSSTVCQDFGRAKLYLGDCQELLDVARGAAVASDPPYEFRGKGGGRFRAERKAMNEIHDQGLDRGFDLTPFTPELSQTLVLFCHNDQLPSVLAHVEKHFDRWALLSWHKSNPLPMANKHYRPDTEYWVHAWMAGNEPVGKIDDLRRWYLGPVGKSPFDHPTVKPVELMTKVIRSIPDHTIFDPFMGTGSTGVAALKLGRQFIGVEIDPKYFDIACRRIEFLLRTQPTDQAPLTEACQ